MFMLVEQGAPMPRPIKRDKGFATMFAHLGGTTVTVFQHNGTDLDYTLAPPRSD